MPSIKAKKKSKVNRKHFKREKLFVLSVVLFALIGSIYLFRTMAAPAVSVSPNELLLEYYRSNPTSLVHDLASDTYKFESLSEVYAVRGDGTLHCDSGTGGELVEGKLSTKQLKKLYKEVESLKVQDLPLNIYSNPNVVVDNEAFVITTPNGVTATSIDKNSSKPDKLVKMQDKIVKTCQKYANKKVKRGNPKEFKVPEPARSSGKKFSLVDKLVSGIVGRAEAGQNVPGYNVDNGLSTDQARRNNSLRASRGLYQFQGRSCLDLAASEWALTMAKSGFIYHNQNTGTLIKKYCEGEGFTYDASNSQKSGASNTWRFIGENVGVVGVQANYSPLLFNTYVASQAHFANLVNNKGKCQGNGAYHDLANNKVYHTFLNATWAGGPCQ